MMRKPGPGPQVVFARRRAAGRAQKFCMKRAPLAVVVTTLAAEKQQPASHTCEKMNATGDLSRAGKIGASRLVRQRETRTHASIAERRS